MTTKSYIISYAAHNGSETFDCPRRAGAAFYHANTADQPRTIEYDSKRNAARVIARTIRIGDELHKSVADDLDPPAFVKGFKTAHDPDFPF